eukprot:TRINITY_DN6483_c0_g2_i2.p1 TRINITY_DN6483_c0_g2~~TRINITY_DN6483_c0_g2_i2.p1  ORF type:complete len:121 (-),score=23.94 TRINITY_DN6483_c0_g2_i2:33-395(-)
MLAYLLLVKPFKSDTNNVMNVYNELVIMVCFLSVLAMNLLNLAESARNIWGWILIGLVLISLLSIWATTIPDMISTAWNYFKSRKKDNENEKNKVPKKKTAELPANLTNSLAIKVASASK